MRGRPQHVVARSDLGGNLKKMTTIAAALALACTAVAMFAGALLAQAGPKVYEACASGRQEIRAGSLPAVVDANRCPVEGRTIVDGGIGVVVPEPGMTIAAHGRLTSGDQYLMVSNPRGDEISFEGVGTEPRSEASSDLGTLSTGPSPCKDAYRKRLGYKLYNYNRWYANVGSIPDYLSKKGAAAAMKRGGVNIFKVQDSCGIPDRVKGELRYEGGTSRSADIDADASCNANDGKSVIGFGDLPSGYTAYACVASWMVNNGPDRVASSDIRLNKEDHAWTTGRGSCGGRYDVESSVTHERGHTFGLGEAPESSHGNLTMSAESNGPCQTSERSLGLGDAKGLNSKY